MSVCVAKGIANRLIDVVILHSKALYGSGKVYNYFWNEYSTFLKEIASKKKKLKSKVRGRFPTPRFI